LQRWWELPEFGTGADRTARIGTAGPSGPDYPYVAQQLDGADPAVRFDEGLRCPPPVPKSELRRRSPSSPRGKAADAPDEEDLVVLRDRRLIPELRLQVRTAPEHDALSRLPDVGDLVGGGVWGDDLDF